MVLVINEWKWNKGKARGMTVMEWMLVGVVMWGLNRSWLYDIWKQWTHFGILQWFPISVPLDGEIETPTCTKWMLRLKTWLVTRSKHRMWRRFLFGIDSTGIDDGVPDLRLMTPSLQEEIREWKEAHEQRHLPGDDPVNNHHPQNIFEFSDTGEIRPYNALSREGRTITE